MRHVVFIKVIPLSQVDENEYNRSWSALTARRKKKSSDIRTEKLLFTNKSNTLYRLTHEGFLLLIT